MTAAEIASIIPTMRDISIAALFVLLFWMWWTERKDQKKRELSDRELLTTQLSSIIDREIQSRESQTTAFTKLADSITSFQKNCIEIQRNFQDEVNRMKRNNDTT